MNPFLSGGRGRRLCRLAILMLGAAGCAGDSPTEPGSDIQVLPAAPLLAHVNDSLVLTATKDGQPVGSLSLGFVSEVRGIAELPVLQLEALSRGVLKPAGPGSAVLNVSSTAGKARVTVRVEPVGPTIFGAVVTQWPAGGDTITLLGTGLGNVPLQGAVRIAGEAVSIVHRDANRLRFLMPRMAMASCEGPAFRAPVQLNSGQVRQSLTVPVEREGEVRLHPSTYRMLSAEEVACLRLPANGGEYVLAYVDLRQEVKGRTGWAGWPGDPYEVRVRDRTVSGATTVTAAVLSPQAITLSNSMDSGDSHVRRWDGGSPNSTCSDTDFSLLTFWCRSKPWAVGESMTIRKPGSVPAEYVTATVWRVFGNGRFPVAVVDGDNSQALQDFKAGIEAAMPDIAATSVPLLQAVFGSSTPNSSEASGQLLTIIGDFQHSSVGYGCCFGGVPWEVVTLGSWHAPWPSEVFYLFTHEFAHAWQQRWFYDHRPEGGEIVPTATWANEGGADLLAYEAQRRYAKVPWRANRTFISFDDGGKPDGPLVRESYAAGDLATGYVHGSSFFRDVVARMVAAGIALDVAYREVSLGSLEEWHGWDLRGVKRPGLTDRVAALLPGWDPSDALLLYTLAQGADDLTVNPALQNPFYHSVGMDPLIDGFARLRIDTGSGGEVAAARIATSMGYMRVVDSGAGGSLEVSADRPDIRWAIARVR